MNKVFKVIWCNATQAMVAVSEFAKSQGKSSSCQSSKPASLGVKLSKLTVSLMLIFSGSAIAIDGAVEHGNNAIAGKNGVAVGKNAKSNITENGNTAQRNDAYINAVEDAVQKGIEASQQPNATVESIKSAVVARLNQSGINNIYFSNYIPSVITGDSIENALNALRDKATEALYVGTIAIGKDAAANKATDTIALGRKAKAGMKVQHVNAISIGANSRSTERNAIALGARAAAKGDSAITIGKDSMSSGTGAISVGANGFSEGTGTMSVGKNTMAYKDGSMALGAFAHAGNKDDTGSKYAIAIGQNSLASKGQSIAIGGGRDSNQGAVATGSQSIAIGGNTIAEGDSSIAIGGDDTNTAVAQDIDYTVTVASEGGVDVVKTQHKTIGDIYTELTGDDLQRMSHPDAGFTPNTNNKFGRYRNTVAGHAAVAIGDKAYAKGALGVAYGTGATVEDDAVAGTALGAGAKSTKINGVALGAGSQTDLDAKLYKKAEVQVLDIYGNAIPGKTAIFNGFSGGADNLQTGDQVSVGAKGFERQIKNVAAGWVNRESTDAINGSQLASVAGALKGEIDKAGKNTPFEYVDENNKPVDKLDDGNYYEENTVVLNPVNNKAYEAGTVLGSNGKGYKPDTVLYKDNPYPAGSIISGGKVYPKGTRFKSDGTAIDAAGNVAQEIASDPSLEITEADRIAAVTPKQRVANNVVIHAKSDASKAPKRVTNVAAGVEDTDAVNVSQIQNYFHTNTSSSAVSGNTTNLDLVNGIGGAKGGYSVAAGVNAQATGNYGSMALGYNSAASTSGAIALGMNSISAGESSVSIGYNATSSGQGSVSLGRKTKTTGSSVALGNLAEATGSSVAIGDESMASEASFAMGNKAKTTGAANVAIGNHALTEGTQSMAIGQGAQAKVEESLALGSFTHALGKQSVAIGNDAFATGEMSTVIGTRYIGNRTMANGHLGHGTSTSTDGKFAIAIGSGTGTSGDTVKKDQIAESDADYGIALGTSSRTEVGAEASVAIGRLSQTRVAGGVALGSESIANRKSIDSTKVTASETIDITTTDLIQETDNVYALDVADGDDKTKIKNTVKGELGAVSVGTVTRKFKTRKPGFRYTGDSEETGVKTGNDIAAAEFEIEVATRQIINVAAGSADTDAVNVAQLKAVANVAKKKSVETVSAGDGVGITTSSNVGGVDYKVAVNVDDKTIEIVTIDENGNKVIKQADGTYQNESGNTVTPTAVTSVVVAKTADITTTDGLAIPVDENALATAKDIAEAINASSFNVQANDHAKEEISAGETVKFVDGDNIKVTQDGANFTIATKKDLVVDSIAQSDTGAKLTLGEDAITLSKGNDPVKLTGVKAGESGTDAVNFTQLKAVKDIAEDKSVETVEASAAAQTSGLTVTETTNTATDKNWKVDLNKDTLATQLVVDGSASKATLEEGLDLTYKANGTTKTTSLKTGLEFANGEGTVASIDADGKVKYGLSDAVQADIAAGKKHTDLTVNGGTSVTDTYNTTGNILAKKTTVDGQTIFDVKLADKVVLGTAGDQVVVDGTAGKVKAGQVTVDGKAGDVTGLTNVDLSGADFGTAGRAATEEQLKLVDTEAKKKSVETVSAGAGIAIAETDGANGKDYAVSVDFGEVAAGNAKAVTGGAVHTAVEAAKESVEADGADAGLTVTKEAVAGKGTKFKVKLDDATKAQLKKEETVSTTDTNLTVDGSATNASGAKDFKLGLAKDLVIDSIGKSATGAKLTLGEDAITLSKGTKPVKLTGIKAGESGTDAVNVDQLEAVRTVASQKTKLVAGVGTTLDGLGTDADPYKVNVDFGTVTAGNTKAVTGGAVYNALADKADKNLSNIDNAGKQVITGLVDAEGKDGISVNTAVDPNTGVKKFTIGLDAATNFAISKVETVSSTNANLLVDDKTQNASGGKEFKVTLNKDLTDLDSVVLGDKVADDVVSLSKDKGINAGKKQITNVASGLGGKNLKDIKNTDAEWNNAATVGDLTKVEGNVTHINKIIGGQNADGKPVDGNGDQLTDSDGNAITTAEALKTYDVRGQTATNDNTVISAIKNMNEGGIKYFHTNDKSGQTVGGDVSDTDDSSASGKYATAIGYNASAAAENTIAFGKGAKATAENSIAIGTGNIVNAKKSGAIGDPSIIEAKDSKGMAVEGVYSIGNDNAINSSDTFVLGNNVNSKKVAGKTVAQGDTVENSVYLGSKTTATKSETNAAGKKVRDVGNKNLKSDGTKGKTTSAGDKGTVKSATVGGITYGGFAGATAKGVVSVGAADSERRIQNVAAGEISRTSTDAINGSQLHATNRALANLSDKLMDIDTGSKAGIAGSAAIAMLGQARNAGDRAISAGFATHRGESALAVGVSSWSDNGKWLLKGSASYDSQRNTTFGGSATYNW
ncbi:ESPR-type extended signal peptide-containing protein [Phocoenobacter skyensis]|uniref:ESPR-type extended signal peptide-containing protein n=1 Tax=Phocoenobacter skyensis TaxID=97481 RepID=A0ABT9JJJ2_9PAST|nr:ESPR-type extended signal peptide-containing protein [Pasteurella skyensis]MDP8079030.1 ESPR-type extended signal peptide-containing protein [Pasteurella skyensis]MDP8084980.1 ESPR-type extended signal peptide-containing protein [Pasteurella skyensis]